MNINTKTQRIDSLLYYKMKPVLEIRIDYPFFYGKLSKRSEKIINAYYIAKAKKMNTYARTQLYTQAVNDYRYASANGFEFNLYSFYNVFETTFLTPQIISLYMDKSEYTGGAHPNTIRNSQTWDALSAKRLQLRDFFLPSFHYREFFIKYITKIAMSPENKENYFDDAPTLIRKNFHEKNFYLTPEGFVIYYQLYTIAPYYIGIPTFTIPYHEITAGGLK